MDTLQISKHELKIVLLITCLIPVLSFIAGFYSADKNGISTANQDKLLSMLLTQTDVNANQQQVSNKQSAQQQQIEIVTPQQITTYYLIQAGLYSKYDNAIQHQADLLKNKLPAVIFTTNHDGKKLFRVVLKSFKTQQAASDFIAAAEQEHKIDLYIAQEQV